MVNFDGYLSIVFDCDGVILDSNSLKSDGFFHATQPYGEDLARAFVEYHRSRGGVSRYAKFEYFLAELKPAERPGPGYDELLERYADYVSKGLRECAVAEGLADLAEQTKHSRWHIVSGGDQAELRTVMVERGIEPYFSGGIFGSPDTKTEILRREIANGNIRLPAIFLGDSRLDWEAAEAMNLDFIFLSDMTEFSEWRSWVNAEAIDHVPNLKALLA